jgi:Peptidase family M1 domain
VLANGLLVSRTTNPPGTGFPGGSVTWHWRSAAPVASYLVQDSVGSYDLTERTMGGVRFYQAQASSLRARRKRQNRAIMNQQADITRFQRMVNGPYPFTSDGALIGRPAASFAEEMQTMITFPGGRISLGLLNHENMHQWWGDNVTEASYNLTFFKEGLATLGDFLFAARSAQARAGGPASRSGRRAFERSLIRQFNAIYASKGRFWTVAPSNPPPYGLFHSSNTYDRPGIAYIALRQILGNRNFAGALRQIQLRYRGAAITEAQLETVFHRWLPDQSTACSSRLDRFFAQWFDTAYKPGGRARRPHITGPGLAGPRFYTAGCTR